MDDVQVLGIIIVVAGFGLGFLGLGIYMFFDKTPRNHIPKPPGWLNNKRNNNQLNHKIMSNLKMQTGESLTADFQENTWTFEMPEDFKITAGNYAIIPKEKFDFLITAIKGISNSMSAHPDCEEGSEFEDMVTRCEEAVENIV